MSAPPPLVLYGKPGCCLCDEADGPVRRVAAEFGLALEGVSILDDADLFARYRYRIPVITWRGRELDEGRVSEGRLRAVLAGLLAEREDAGGTGG